MIIIRRTILTAVHIPHPVIRLSDVGRAVTTFDENEPIFAEPTPPTSGGASPRASIDFDEVRDDDAMATTVITTTIITTTTAATSTSITTTTTTLPFSLAARPCPPPSQLGHAAAAASAASSLDGDFGPDTAEVVEDVWEQAHRQLSS